MKSNLEEPIPDNIHQLIAIRNYAEYYLFGIVP